MKQRLTHTILMLFAVWQAMSQTTISGIITDGHEPLVGANVFILGTIDGCLTDSLGCFSFVTDKASNLTLKATYIGYEDYTQAIVHHTGLLIKMREKSTTIDEVVVTASTYSFGKSDNYKTMNALDVVMAGNSCGDIVAALQTLPGTQKVGEDGKLYVRGGESDECQTFVNGMHVLVPYSTTTENNPSRGRFSPFLFKGINFSLGGYGGEYGQALSSVLPMETTDVATGDKFGVGASLVDWNVGGTKAYHHSSLSYNANYTSMGLYNSLSPDRYDWSRPYRKLSGEAQYKSELSHRSVLKSYFGYDMSSVGQNIDNRSLSLVEHNIYANATLKTDIGKGYKLFTGIANSTVFNDIDNALTADDHYHNIRREIHLKAEVRKVYSPVLKMSAGAEVYFRNSTLDYDISHYDLSYNLLCAHIDAQLKLFPHVFADLSARAEKASYDSGCLLMPRATLSYVPSKRFQMSAIFGRYCQTAEDNILARSGMNMNQSTADHAILSMQHSTASTLLRVEAYHKRYNHLPLLQNGAYQSCGYGTSRGFDIFFECHSLIKNLSTTLSYSFNESERLYLDYTTLRTPEYATRHNLCLTAKYAIGKTIIGMAETYASGRHYPTATTPSYNSIDANVTYLLSPKVIIYTSINNILGRKNIFSFKADGTPVTASRDRFFYIGIFVSLKNTKAYDISFF